MAALAAVVVVEFYMRQAFLLLQIKRIALSLAQVDLLYQDKTDTIMRYLALMVEILPLAI